MPGAVVPSDEIVEEVGDPARFGHVGDNDASARADMIGKAREESGFAFDMVDAGEADDEVVVAPDKPWGIKVHREYSGSCGSEGFGRIISIDRDAGGEISRQIAAPRGNVGHNPHGIDVGKIDEEIGEFRSAGLRRHLHRGGVGITAVGEYIGIAGTRMDWLTNRIHETSDSRDGLPAPACSQPSLFWLP